MDGKLVGTINARTPKLFCIVACFTDFVTDFLIAQSISKTYIGLSELSSSQEGTFYF